MATASTSTLIPPLEPGDRLTRDEFERRYEAMRNLKKAELIEGVVHMPSPARLRKHSRPHGHLITWLGHYEAHTPGVILGGNGTIRLDLKNEPQPDAFLLIDPELGGQAVVDEDDYVCGGPELVAEVSASTVSFDLHAKMEVYRRNRVQEYLVWRVLDRRVDWFVLRQGRFTRLVMGRSGIYKSQVFPGLWLHVEALVSHDLAKVLQVLERGLANREHAAFVARLKKK